MALYTTIAEFALRNELSVVRARLESEGIQCWTLDELTTKFLGGVGGIKLQTLSEDAPRGRALLIEWGYVQEDTEEIATWWIKLDIWTKKIPFFGRINLFIARILVLVAIVASALVVLLWWVLSPSLKEQLTGDTWCVDQVVHNGRPLVANSTIGPDGPYVVVIIDGCSETLRFWPTGVVNVPGFDTPARSGSWTLDGSQITFQGLKDERGIFSGTFDVQLERGHLALRSSSTVIRCTSQWIGWR